MPISKLSFILVSTTMAVSASATNYYVDSDPNSGSDSNSGTSTTPWLTIEHAVSQATGGDTIYLKEGHYGFLYLENVGQDFTTYLNIQPVPGEEATLDYLYTKGARYLKFTGLTVMPTPSAVSQPCRDYIVCFKDSDSYDSSEIIFDQGVVKSVDTISSTEAADPDFWADYTEAGILMSADNSQISNNQISNVAGGIVVGGTKSVTVLNNQIKELAGTGIDISVAQNSTVDGNTIKNFYGRRTNHSSAYSFKAISNSSSGTTRGVTITNNYIIPHETGTVGVDNVKFGGGIMSHQGILDGWTISKNIILSGTWHSITLTDAINLTASHNLEVNYNGDASSFGLRLPAESTSSMTPADINQRVTCNIMSGISAPNVLVNEYNEIGVLTAEDWAVAANSTWDESCNIELTYRLADKTF